MTWYVPQAMAEDIDWIAILILRPLKKAKGPSSLKMVEAVPRIFLYFIYIGLSEHMAILSLG